MKCSHCNSANICLESYQCMNCMSSLPEPPMEETDWISVEERLPENCQSVITWDGKTVKESHFSQWDNGVSWGSHLWYGPVSHWMPLPKPPNNPA